MSEHHAGTYSTDGGSDEDDEDDLEELLKPIADKRQTCIRCESPIRHARDVRYCSVCIVEKMD